MWLLRHARRWLGALLLAGFGKSVNAAKALASGAAGRRGVAARCRGTVAGPAPWRPIGAARGRTLLRRPSLCRSGNAAGQRLRDSNFHHHNRVA